MKENEPPILPLQSLMENQKNWKKEFERPMRLNEVVR